MHHAMECLVGKNFGQEGIWIRFESIFSQEVYSFGCVDNFDPKQVPFPGRSFNKQEVESLRDWLNRLLEAYDDSPRLNMCQNCCKVLPRTATVNDEGYWIVTCDYCEHQHEIGAKIE